MDEALRVRGAASVSVCVRAFDEARGCCCARLGRRVRSVRLRDERRVRKACARVYESRVGSSAERRATRVEGLVQGSKGAARVARVCCLVWRARAVERGGRASRRVWCCAVAGNPSPEFGCRRA